MPLAARLQLLLLAALSSALLHAALLVMHITRLTALLPLDWNKLVRICSILTGPLHITGPWRPAVVVVCLVMIYKAGLSGEHMRHE